MLEADLGTRLFNAQRHQLTEAGQAALPFARAVLEEVAAMRARVEELGRDDRTLRIVSCSPTPLWRLADLATRILPDVIVKSSLVNDPDQGVDLLLRGEADLAVTVGRTNIPGTTCTDLGSERLMVSVPPGHRLARHGELHATDLAGETIVLYRNIGYWSSFDRRMAIDARIIVQDDWEVFVRSTQSPNALHFTPGRPDEPAHEAQGRMVIPLVEEGALACYYVVARLDAHERVKALLGKP